MDIITTICMPGCEPNHGRWLWFPLKLHDGVSGFRLNDGPDVKLVFGGWAHRSST